MNNFFVINAKNLIVSTLIIILLVSVCLAGSVLVDTVVETSANNRLLPVYSVETNKKVVALTFDCAWRCR